MSFLKRLFGSGSSDKGSEDLEERLAKLEAEAENAAPGYVGTSYNRAGDLALKARQQDRAVGYYGRAIDAFLEDGQREAARGVANKIIRVRPDAVRTLCTLTWLDLAAQHSATALMHLREYVEAAKAVDQYSLAASQIYEMARFVPETEFIGAVADALDSLDFSAQGAEVRRWVGSGGSPDVAVDPGELADACLRAAVRSNERGAAPLKSPGGGSAEIEQEPVVEVDDTVEPEAEDALDKGAGADPSAEEELAEEVGDAEDPGESEDAVEEPADDELLEEDESASSGGGDVAGAVHAELDDSKEGGGGVRPSGKKNLSRKQRKKKRR